MSLTAEDLRFEARRFLYSRPTASLSLDTIRHGLARQGSNASPEELEAALVFLAGLEPSQVTITAQELGGSKRYQITSAGILAYERNR